jgi:hypothetical protein
MRTVTTIAMAVLLVGASDAGHAQAPQGRLTQSGNLISDGSGLCATLAFQSSNDGVNVQQGDCRRGPADWDVIDVGRGEVAFVNRATGRVLDVAGASGDDGANVQQYTWNGTNAQRWRIQGGNRGSVQIVNVGSGKCLDVDSNSQPFGANIQQYGCHGRANQSWRIGRGGSAAPIPPPPPQNDYGAGNNGGRPQGRALYSGLIQSRATGKCVDVDRRGRPDGANIQQWSCHGSGNQIFEVIDVGRGEVVVMNTESGKVMEVQGGSWQNGADVAQWSWNGGQHQRWRMEATDRGYFRFINAGTRKCLDLDGASTADGANIAQSQCHNGANQQWRVEIRSSGGSWSGYQGGQNWWQPDRPQYDTPPGFVVGNFRGYSNYFNANVQLSVSPDGTVWGTVEGGQRVAGYFRGGQLHFGNARYDVSQDRNGFRAVQVGQPNNVMNYQRVR